MRRASAFRHTLYRIIFEHDTPAGRAFDVVVIAAILLSVVAVMLDSVGEVSARYGPWLRGAEWFFTILFTIEYVLRLYSAPRPGQYALSFYGIIDLLAILPTYLSVLFPTARFVLILRILRVLRVFRILKLVRFLGEAQTLRQALRASRYKITVFVATVLAIVTIVGSLMYMIEGAESGFTSIPRSIYWAIVTLTTVGYGDIAPRTPVGQALAALLMITGYGVIAVPTGIVTVELGRAAAQEEERGRAAARLAPGCPGCGRAGHDADAAFCKHCGTPL